MRLPDRYARTPNLSAAHPPTRPPSLPFALLLAALLALPLAGCTREPAEAPDLPDPPSIVEPVPGAPTPADAGQPGNWEALRDATPAARCFVVEPATGTAATVGVLLVHGRWGVNGDVRALARQLASRGHVVLAPDLFEGVVVTARAAGNEIIEAVVPSRATALLGAGLAQLRAHPGVRDGRVAIVAQGIGGGWVTALATPPPGLAGIVFDSTPLYFEEDAPHGLSAPVLILAGELSSGFTQERRSQIDAAFRQAGVPLAWERIPGAGTDLLDPRALGFSAAGYDAALGKVTEFLRSVG